MYVSTKEFALAAGLDRRSAARICKEAFISNKTWFGRKLDVRVETGQRGGRSGCRYMVACDSLPDLFRALNPAAARPVCAATAGDCKPASRLDHARIIKAGDRRSDVIMLRYGAIKHALAAPFGTEERRVCIAASALHTGVSEATIYRWLDRFALGGLAGLAPQPRQHQPTPIRVSRHFDQRFLERNPDGEEKLASVGNELEMLIKSIWTTRSSMSGMSEVARNLAILIRSYCEQSGFDVNDIDCTPSVRRIKAFRDYSLVRTILYDAKRKNNIRPRIRRTYDDVAPMEIVFVDVKLCDIFLKEGKKRIRPALVGFLDAGTGRLFAHLVKLRKGNGINVAHVTEAFANMVAHPLWGIPRYIYTDNGSEMHGMIRAIAKIQDLKGKPTLIQAQPDNPQAKPIEGLFSNLNRTVFSKMEGFTGGKARTLRARQSPRKAVPYPGSWEMFCEELFVLLAEYHSFRRPKRPSPDDLFAEKRTSMNVRLDFLHPKDALSIFGKPLARMVGQGTFTVRGQRYTDPSLYIRHGETIQLICRNKAADEVWSSDPGGALPDGPHLLGEDGQLYRVSHDEPYGPLDRAGAQESEARNAGLELRAAEMLQELRGRSAIPNAAKLAAARTLDRQRRGGSASSGTVTAEGKNKAKLERKIVRELEANQLDNLRSEEMRRANHRH